MKLELELKSKKEKINLSSWKFDMQRTQEIRLVGSLTGYYIPLSCGAVALGSYQFTVYNRFSRPKHTLIMNL